VVVLDVVFCFFRWKCLLMLYVLCLLMLSYLPADAKLKKKMSPGTKTAGGKNAC
jgi:hypothetical protein